MVFGILFIFGMILSVLAVVWCVASSIPRIHPLTGQYL